MAQSPDDKASLSAIRARAALTHFFRNRQQSITMATFRTATSARKKTCAPAGHRKKPDITPAASRVPRWRPNVRPC
jgi:hypothetical protein